MKVSKLVCIVLIPMVLGVLSAHYERLQYQAARTSIIHVIQPGDTVWDLAGPVAENQGLDIRDVVYQMLEDNNLGPDALLIPGREIVINTKK